MSSADTSPPFAPTRWTLILRARGETPQARAALGELCEHYYQPVLRFLRREGRDEDAARELTQEFFARVLGGRGFEGADPSRGRFRSYLLGALKHFLADQRERAKRLKRGGGINPDSLDAPVETEAGAVAALEAPAETLPDIDFDREWALTVMDRALRTLQRDFASAEKAEQFEVLKPWLMGETPALSQAESARTLELTEAAVKVAVHRLRKRFRDAVRAEIGQTLRDPAMVDEELKHLVEALS